jgi:hypothetical protein
MIGDIIIAVIIAIYRQLQEYVQTLSQELVPVTTEV